MRARALGVATTFAVLIGAIVVYWVYFLTSGPSAISATVNKDGSANLTLQVVPAYGHHPFPDWVSYLAKDSSGRWRHTTIYKVPPHAIVHVTIYQYDSQTGLRNPFFGQIRGTVGGVARYTDVGNTGKGSGLPLYDDTAESVLPPGSAAHTFTDPDLGLNVPLVGISDTAKNACSVAPCATSFAHTTIQFSFRTPGPGSYRWQCIVPCALGFLDGFGGPMQTIGYMDGLIVVT
jgi:hypothetical protein